MTTIDTGTYGAKRQSFRKASPRDLLRQMVEENKHSSEKTLHKKFATAVRNDDDYLDAIIEYWFANNYRSLVHKPEHVVRVEHQQRNARVETIKERVKIAATRMVLLDMVLPSGKSLRDSTGKECKKAGGWLTKVAALLKPTQKVGDVLSESKVKELFRGAA